MSGHRWQLTIYVTGTVNSEDVGMIERVTKTLLRALDELPVTDGATVQVIAAKVGDAE